MTCILTSAKDRADLDQKIAPYLNRNIKVVDVQVLIDDSQEVVNDLRIIEIADTEETCVNYDWTTDNVVSFARKVLEEYIKNQNKAA